MLSKQAIDEYKKIYKEEFGKEISDEQANEWGTELIELMKIFLRKS